jgi:hypothetical protein
MAPCCVIRLSAIRRTEPYALNRVTALISQCVPRDGASNNNVAISGWTAAASETLYAEEVCQRVQIARVDSLRPHVLIDIWRWLRKQPSLPPWESPSHILLSSGWIVISF